LEIPYPALPLLAEGTVSVLLYGQPPTLPPSFGQCPARTRGG